MKKVIETGKQADLMEEILSDGSKVYGVQVKYVDYVDCELGREVVGKLTLDCDGMASATALFTLVNLVVVGGGVTR